MAYVRADRVMESSTTTGTGAFTLAGAIAGFRTFASVLSVSDTVHYVIEAVNTNGVPTGEWETGLGTYSGANTLTRTTVIASSNGGAAVNFSAGTKRVAISNITASILSSSGGTVTGQTIVDFGSGAIPGSLPTNGTPYIWVKAADGTHPGRVLLDAFGGHLGYSARRANGTRAAPSALVSGDSIGFLNGFGYGATDYSLTGRIVVDMQASENWTDSAQGTKLIVQTTPNGSTTAADAAEIGQDKSFKSYGPISTSYIAGVNFVLGNTIANAETVSAVQASAQLHGTAANPPSFAQIRWDNASSGGAPTSFFARSRGTTLNSRGVVQSGDRIGQILASADDGTNFVSLGAIRFEVDGTPGTNDMPGRINFLVSPDGSATLAEAMRIDNNRMTKLTGSFSRGAPVTKTADFTVAATENWLINNKSGSTCTVTLPSASTFTGREIRITNYQAQTVVSASSNVVPIAGGAAGTAILAATAGVWATLVSDGTNWLILQS